MTEKTYIRSTAVHLQRSDRSNQHHRVGPQAWSPTFDVEELLHPDVRSESGLRHCEGTGAF